MYQTTSKAEDPIKWKLQNLISQYGPPKWLFTNNGPPFSLEALERFLSTQHIDHVTSSLHYPKSNSFIERQTKVALITAKA